MPKQVEQNWFFHWMNGGYNSVQASSKQEALEKAKHLARFTILVPDPESFVLDPDNKRVLAENARYVGMFD